MTAHRWTSESAGREHFTHSHPIGEGAIADSDLGALAFYLYTTLVWVDLPGDFEARRRDAIRAYESFPWREARTLRDAYEAGYADADSGFDSDFTAWLHSPDDDYLEAS